MGRRSRKRSVSATAPRTAAPAPPRTSRSEARNAEVRAQLRPLAPGERPPLLLIAIGISVVLGVGNLAAYAAGQEIDGMSARRSSESPCCRACCSSPRSACGKGATGRAGLPGAPGHHRRPGRSSRCSSRNLAAVLVSVAIVGLGGWPFWKLVRIMARLRCRGWAGPDRGGRSASPAPPWRPPPMATAS